MLLLVNPKNNYLQINQFNKRVSVTLFFLHNFYYKIFFYNYINITTTVDNTCIKQVLMKSYPCFLFNNTHMR